MAGCTSKRRSRLVAGIGAMLCAGTAFAASANAPSKVTAVRFWSLGDVTRVAIEVSSEFRYKSDRLNNPDRLFFDIQGSKPAIADTKATHVIPVGDAIVKQIRVAETQPGITRVVIDLEQSAEFTASQLSSPARLMIELRLKDRPSPPTTSVTGAKKLNDTGERATEEAAPPPVLTAPVAKVEPRKFAPPPVREEAPRPAPETKTELLTQPSSTLVAKTTRVAPPGPPVAMAIARNIAPPPGVAPDAPKELPKPAAKSEPVAESLPAKRNANGDRSLTRVLGLKLGRVVIDPGHGGHDAGTHGPSGLLEKDLVLDVAKRLGTLLEDGLGSEVV